MQPSGRTDTIAPEPFSAVLVRSREVGGCVATVSFGEGVNADDTRRRLFARDCIRRPMAPRGASAWCDGCCARTTTNKQARHVGGLADFPGRSYQPPGELGQRLAAAPVRGLGVNPSRPELG